MIFPGSDTPVNGVDIRYVVSQEGTWWPHPQTTNRGNGAGRERLASRAIAQLRLVPERKQRLTAPCSGARARDLQYLIDCQVRALAAAGRRLLQRMG